MGNRRSREISRHAALTDPARPVAAARNGNGEPGRLHDSRLPIPGPNNKNPGTEGAVPGSGAAGEGGARNRYDSLEGEGVNLQQWRCTTGIRDCVRWLEFKRRPDSVQRGFSQAIRRAGSKSDCTNRKPREPGEALGAWGRKGVGGNRTFRVFTQGGGSESDRRCASREAESTDPI